MYRLTLIVFLVFLNSCVSVKYKKNYIINSWESFNKYNYQKELSLDVFNGQIGLSLNDSKLRKLKMKKIKADINYLERNIALSPDSISATLVSQINKINIVDSFYVNEEKIRYITQNGLLTPNKHFIKVGPIAK